MDATRRQFITTAGTVAAGALVAGGTIASQAVAGVTAGVTAGAAGAIAASSMPNPADSGIDHIIVLMMENRSFDHFLGWVPGADGKQAGLNYRDRYGLPRSTYHLADFQGCGHPDPDHSYEGGRIQFNGGACDGWLKAGESDEFAVGYYDADDLDFWRQAAPDWTICDRYFAATMAETYPNRFYQHSAATDRTHNSTVTSTLPTIWDRLADAGLGGKYYFGDVPFTALWGTKYLGISHPHADFLADCASGALPEVSFVDPRFSDEGSGTSGDDHPHADIRSGELFLAEVYAAVTRSPASARRGHIAHDTYDHTSVLKAIEWRWGLAPLTSRDAAARNIAEVLDFDTPVNLRAPGYQVPPFVAGAPCAPVGTPSVEEWPALRQKAVADGWML